MTKVRRIALAVIVAGAASLLAACGSSSPTAAPTTTSTAPRPVTTSPAVYATDAATARAALNGFVKAVNADASMTGAQAAPRAATAAAALSAFDAQLAAAHWPAAATGDVHALIRADGALVGDLESVGSVTAFSASTWVQTFARDGQAAHAAATIVRSDLGLPPS